MKKIIITGLLSVFVSVVFAQLKVTQDGKVGIGITTTPISKFAVGSTGDIYYPNSFNSEENTMRIISNGAYTNLGNIVSSLRVWMDATAGRIYYGLWVSAYKTSTSSSGRSIGIISEAGNATSGYNAGVAGLLNGSNNGAGIVGSSNGVVPYIDGHYSGYFDGNVKITGTVNGTVIGSSDVRLKQNVSELGSNDRKDRAVLNTVTSLNPISYNFKQVYAELPPSDTIQATVGMFDENSTVFKKMHFGLIAQDLQKVYPDLVYENDNGYLSINYTEIIPLLIQSIKELKEEVDLLSSALVDVRSTTPNDIFAETSGAVLYQNAPNPFSDRTEIKFSLPENTVNALIYIFNMQGTLIKQITVNASQSGIFINGSELTAGIYLYSLIVNGKEIDTKKMILTK